MGTAILLSGGIDSIALAYLYRREIDFAITINYGQKSALKEIEVSSKICRELNIKHEIITVDCKSLGGGEMCDDKPTISSIPEWWPFRNQLIITLASMKAASIGIKKILIGTVKTDRKFSDGSPSFFKTINSLVSIQEGGILIEAPSINLTSYQLIKKSKIPESILYWAHSCHTGNEPCGVCNGCVKYLDIVEELNK